MNNNQPKPLRVLLVEDSTDDTFLLLRTLRREGYQPHHLRVDTLADTTDALRSGQWDIVISDYNLPGFSALEVLELVRTCGHDIPVLIVSGAIGEEAAVATMRAGAHDYIMKDNTARLGPAIERELREAEERRARRSAQEALRQSEQRFRELTEAIEEVFWLIDCERAAMLYVSPNYQKIWQADPAPLMKRLSAFLDTIHPEDYDRVQVMLECDGWAGFNGEYRIQRPDGSRRWVSTRSFAIRDEAGRVVRIAGISTDITERKALEGERRKLLGALEQTADAVVITNRDGRIEYVNRAFEEMSGYRKEEVLDRQPRFLRSGFQDRDFYHRVAERLRTGMPFSDVFISRRKNGDLFYEDRTITPVRDSRGDVTRFVATSRDITHRLRLEQQVDDLAGRATANRPANRLYFVERLNASLQQAQRLDLKAGVLRVGMGIGALLGQENSSKLEDALMQAVIRRLREAVGAEGVVARLDQGEFAVLCREVPERDGLERTARAIIELFSEPLTAGGYELYLTPSIGISLFPDTGNTPDELLRNAEIAMQAARREESTAGYQFFENDTRPGAKPPKQLTS